MVETKMNALYRVKAFVISQEDEGYTSFIARHPEFVMLTEDSRIAIYMNEWFEDHQGIEIVSVVGPQAMGAHISAFVVYTEDVQETGGTSPEASRDVSRETSGS